LYPNDHRVCRCSSLQGRTDGRAHAEGPSHVRALIVAGCAPWSISRSLTDGPTPKTPGRRSRHERDRNGRSPRPVRALARMTLLVLREDSRPFSCARRLPGCVRPPPIGSSPQRFRLPLPLCPWPWVLRRKHALFFFLSNSARILSGAARVHEVLGGKSKIRAARHTAVPPLRARVGPGGARIAYVARAARKTASRRRSGAMGRMRRGAVRPRGKRNQRGASGVESESRAFPDNLPIRVGPGSRSGGSRSAFGHCRHSRRIAPAQEPYPDPRKPFNRASDRR